MLRAINPSAKLKTIGIRPGEKLHEQMIGNEDSPFTYDYGDYFKILPSGHNWYRDEKNSEWYECKCCSFTYNSNTNDQWMTVESLREWIDANSSEIGFL